MRQRDLMPQCGTFTTARRRRIIGVILMKGVPRPRGEWWVGGKQVAIVQWADKAIRNEKNQTTLYTAVKRHVSAGTTQENVLRAIEQDPLLEIAWRDPAMKRSLRRDTFPTGKIR